MLPNYTDIQTHQLARRFGSAWVAVVKMADDGRVERVGVKGQEYTWDTFNEVWTKTGHTLTTDDQHMYTDQEIFDKPWTVRNMVEEGEWWYIHVQMPDEGLILLEGIWKDLADHIVKLHNASLAV